jgi:predicted metalloprotease with PDZ domain
MSRDGNLLEEFANEMRKALNIKILGFLIIALIFSMYQESPAQRKKPRTKTTTVEVKPVPPTIDFTVSMSKPWTHLLEVEMRLNWTMMPAQAEIVMPVWTPGSYLVREYARHVEDFAVQNVDGANLTWRKTNKNTWQIDTNGAKEIIVKYNVYANELTVRTNELNSDHAFFTPAALLMNPKGQIAAASTVKVVPYGNWKVATGLPKVEGQTNVFRAENFDVLYDSPFEVSDFKEFNFTVQGKPHRYVFSGEGNYDGQRIVRDTTKIIEECYKIFGELPYNDYTFIVNLRGGGGLEHLNSTALQWNRLGFSGGGHTNFLSLVTHEFFHLWNVKRIRPDVLGPFDYSNENYTKLLWVAEGATSYYENVILRRAGLIDDSTFLSDKASKIQALQERPGRFETSLEEASFDAWIKYYRQDENSVNNQISYYDKGDIVNFLLDIEIRTASKGAKSLDDVFIYLNNEFAKKNKNFTPEDYQKTSETMAGKSLDYFFSKFVRGREEITYSAILNGIGLELVSGQGGQNAYLGTNLRQDGDRLTITSVLQGSAAYEQGLNSGDQIVAIDGNRASQNFLQSYLGMKKAGDEVKFTIFRFDRLREITIKLGSRAFSSYTIRPISNLSEEQRRLYREYLGADLE